ncbi:transmembrane protein [Heterostelium album PN500]|uniref:Glycerophosphocholine acyltransferase 1 n=1 Tax=Heterostelium pallidum (strain ATCC 26659 / Pp 5 / PN500) TaxID=670386 RepID=D3BD86_HETP5|nr:transmembrane protein [Heterostelium album PN500]EFA80878.1 transmembrane protein [Heterostelium album PN500]|eukprot:XP_020432997.1 transmembrane protein [Heterostelium album PN500]
MLAISCSSSSSSDDSPVTTRKSGHSVRRKLIDKQKKMLGVAAKYSNLDGASSDRIQTADDDFDDDDDFDINGRADAEEEEEEYEAYDEAGDDDDFDDDDEEFLPISPMSSPVITTSATTTAAELLKDTDVGSNDSPVSGNASSHSSNHFLSDSDADYNPLNREQDDSGEVPLVRLFQKFLNREALKNLKQRHAQLNSKLLRLKKVVDNVKLKDRGQQLRKEKEKIKELIKLKKNQLNDQMNAPPFLRLMDKFAFTLGLIVLMVSEFVLLRAPEYIEAYLVPILLYFFWQAFYIIKTEYIDEVKLANDQDIMTSSRWMSVKQPHPIYKLLKSRGINVSPVVVLMITQLIYTFGTLIALPFFMNSFIAHSSFLFFIFIFENLIESFITLINMSVPVFFDLYGLVIKLYILNLL